MNYIIDKVIFEKFPGFRRAVVLTENIDNHGEKQDLLNLLQDAHAWVRSGELAAFPDIDRLQIWVEAFNQLGINPKKNPPSVINMIKRVRSGKDLPYISSLVSIFNLVSLKNLISCGGDDLSVVTGDLKLTLAEGTEKYTPLGQTGTVENPAPGEVIYLDTGSREVFCRAWCWKNGDVSKIRPETKLAAINIDCMMPAVSLAELEKIAEQMAAHLQKFTGAKTDIRLLSPENPSFSF